MYEFYISVIISKNVLICFPIWYYAKTLSCSGSHLTSRMTEIISGNYAMLHFKCWIWLFSWSSW